MQNIKNLCIKSEDIVKTIDLDLVDDEIMKNERKGYISQFDYALSKFEKEVNKTTDGDLKRALFLCFRSFKNKLLDYYSNHLLNKDLGNIDDEDENLDLIFSEVLLFTNIISHKFDEFRTKIEKELDIQLTTYNGEFNKFKKCPYCKLVWFKIKGCDNMRCGNRTRIVDKIFGRFKNYGVSYSNNLIIIDKMDFQQNLTENDSEFFGLTNEEETIIKRGQKRKNN